LRRISRTEPSRSSWGSSSDSLGAGGPDAARVVAAPRLYDTGWHHRGGSCGVCVSLHAARRSSPPTRSDRDNPVGDASQPVPTAVSAASVFLVLRWIPRDRTGTSKYRSLWSLRLLSRIIGTPRCLLKIPWGSPPVWDRFPPPAPAFEHLAGCARCLWKPQSGGMWPSCACDESRRDVCHVPTPLVVVAFADFTNSLPAPPAAARPSSRLSAGIPGRNSTPGLDLSGEASLVVACSRWRCRRIRRIPGQLAPAPMSDEDVVVPPAPIQRGGGKTPA